MYIEAPNAGYFNVQHFQTPGIEWAYDVFFYIDGTGALLVGNDSVNFNFPKAAWFEVKQLINLEADSATMYVNGVMINQWPFHYSTDDTTGTNQLGGVDFYSQDATYHFFVDDVLYTQLSEPLYPILVVTPDSIGSWMAQGENQTVQLFVSDTGVAPLTYQANIIYDSIPDLGLEIESDSLGHDTENTSAIGWAAVPITVSVAARYPNEMTVMDAGMRITAVQVFINDLNSSASNEMTLKIWGMGNSFEPGPILYQQNFTPAGGNWETITLTTPVFVSGEDLWVGYTFTQADSGIFIPGVDAGPANPNGDYLSTGAGWTHLSSNPDLNYNWNIRAKLEGMRIPQWLTVTPDTGTVEPNMTDTLQVMMTNDSLLPGTYTATIRILSNDPLLEWFDVPVVLLVAGVGVRETNTEKFIVYPNPASDIINIVTNSAVEDYRIFDISGKPVMTGKTKTLNIRDLSPGVYIIQANTSSGTSLIRFVKQ